MTQPVNAQVDRFAGITPPATVAQTPTPVMQEPINAPVVPAPVIATPAPEVMVAPVVQQPVVPQVAPVAPVAPVVPATPAPQVIQQQMDIGQVNAYMQRMQSIQTAAGGADAFNNAMQWAKDNTTIPADARNYINESLNSTNPLQAAQAAQYLSSLHQASPAFQQTPNLVVGDTQGVPAVSPTHTPITSREYAEGLMALRNDGKFDGQDYSHPDVQALKMRLLQSVADNFSGAYN